MDWSPQKNMQSNHALPVTREEDFSRWFQEVIAGADLADHSEVRGCMVIKPYGFSIWELIKSILDERFKAHGQENCYFPLFIPIDLFEKESEHISGFAKEMAVVTHHRIERRDGKLIPTCELETPLAVRPTSEMIIGRSFSKWIRSYRDLPLKVNQWCNVVRWEMRPRLFLRTSEFLWQEGHSAYETELEAIDETIKMHEVYYDVLTNNLMIYAMKGKKPDHERFPGALETYTVEAMMQDGKALQCTTSHFLGQNFARASDIQFQDKEGTMQYAYTTSFGSTTRLIGGLVMVHGDDDGLNLPSHIAPNNIVIIPTVKNESDTEGIINYCNSIKEKLAKYRVSVDLKDNSPQNKKWKHIKRGVPIICEIGQREVSGNSVSFIKRLSLNDKHSVNIEKFIDSVDEILNEHDQVLFTRSKENFERKARHDISALEQLKEWSKSNENGFAFGKLSQNEETIKIIEDLGLSVRIVKESSEKGKCIVSGKESFVDAILAKAY
jgi:prolyl-tRNA synthetase